MSAINYLMTATSSSVWINLLKEQNKQAAIANLISVKSLSTKQHRNLPGGSIEEFREIVVDPSQNLYEKHSSKKIDELNKKTNSPQKEHIN